MKYLTTTINVSIYWNIDQWVHQVYRFLVIQCITRSILPFVCKQCATWSQIRRTWRQWKNKCTKLSLVSKQKLHISVSDKLHFINFSRESSVTSMLKELKWPTLQQRRTNTKVVMMYRIVHHLIAISSQMYLTHATTRTTRGHDQKCQIPF